MKRKLLRSRSGGRLLEMFQRLTAAARDAVIVMDPRGRISFWNKAAERILGYRNDEAIGQRLHEFIVPERFQSAFHKAYPPFQKSGEGAAVGQTLELVAVRKDGSEIPVELSLAAELLRDGWHAVGILRDVSVREEKDALLRAAKSRAEQLFRLVPSAVFTVDTGQRITSINSMALSVLGLTEDEVVGKSCRDLLDDTSCHCCGLLDDSIEKPVFGLECLIRTRDGRELEILRTIDLLRDEEDRVIGGIESFVDITEQKAVQAELEQARHSAEASTRAKSDFLANMSHEIRTPMNAVIGLTGLLLETDLTEEQQDYAETIRRSGSTLLSIINNILDFSKIESGMMELDNHLFSLRTCVEDAVDLLASQAAEKNLEVMYEVGGGTPEWLEGDDTRLGQILVNLLSNAVKFTKSGEIEIQVRSTPVASGEVVLHVSVSDTGLGIPRDRMDAVFRSFSQVDASTTRNYGGTGLGLAICRRLCELMRGEIWCESEQGKGSTFHFTVRMGIGEGPAPDFRAKAYPKLKGRRVLIVDDSATNRRILCTMLESWGMSPRAEATPQAALERVRFGEHFDLAILDMQMPDMNGLTLAKGLRSYCCRESMPIVLLSSGEPEATAGGALPAVDATLQKPLKADRLFSIIVQLLVDPAGEESAEQEPPPCEPAPNSNLRILLAEDNLVNQMVALRMLEKLGYEADLAVNGLEVLDAMDRRPYDVILMDVQMPEMDGLTATREIRSRLSPFGRPYVIAITANAMEEDRKMCLDAGMDAYVAKPIELEDLRQALIAADPFASHTDMAPASSGAPAIDFTVIEKVVGVGEDRSLELTCELVDIFGRTTPDTLANLAQAIEAGIPSGVRLHAHSLRGSAASLGAGALSSTCQTLEAAADKGDLSGAARSLSRIKVEFGRALAELRAHVG